MSVPERAEARLPDPTLTPHCSEEHCKANDPCAWCGYSRENDLVGRGIEAIEREHWHCRLNPSVPCGELAAVDALRRRRQSAGHDDQEGE